MSNRTVAVRRDSNQPVRPKHPAHASRRPTGLAIGWLTLAIVAGLVPMHGSAEGTFELRQGTAATDEVFLEGSLSTGNVNYDQHRVTFLRVDVFDPADEVIDLYGEALSGSPDVQVWCPGGLPLPTPDAPYSAPAADFTADFSATAGQLTSFADVVDVQTLPRSIAPVTYALSGSRGTCGEPGIYTVRFASAGIDTGGQEFFDIRVRNTATDTLETGRVWADKYALSMGRSSGRLGSELYVVAGEDRGSDYLGVTWLLDLNNIAPFGFQLYANARGVGPAQYNYRSIGGSASPPPELDPQFPIYLNPPAKPVTTPGLVGTIEAIEPVCTPGVSNDVVIRFETQGNLPFTIRVDENNDGDFDLSEVIETGESISGTNTVVWDGVLPSGASISPGNSYAIQITLSTGEVHFPFYDVENAAPGPVITPVSIAPSATTDLYFWDDSDPSITSGGGGGTTSGPLGSTTTHNWANGTLGYNDENMIDTWKYASVQRDDEFFLVPPSCAADPRIALSKAAELVALDAGGIAEYSFSFRVENLGNVALANVRLTDDLAATFPAPVSFTVTGVSATGGLVANAGYDGSADTDLLDAAASNLALGDVGLVTLALQVDFNGASGPFTNVATATGDDPGGTPVSDGSTNGVDPDPDGDGVPDESAPTPIPLPAPSLSVSKARVANDDADGSGDVSLGDTLTYTVTASNAGNVTLTGVQVTDTRIAPASAICASVPPGDDCVLTGTYTVIQADVDAGAIANTGRAEADQVAPVEDVLTTPVPQTPALTLVKTGAVDDGGDGAVDAGDTIDYAFTVTNVGNVTLTDIALSDPLVPVSGGPLAALAPGASDSTTFTATYTLTQADIDAGSFTNTATADSDEGAGDQDSDTRTLPAVPSISLDKTVTGGAPYSAVGDVITYSFLVANTGNVPLTGPVTIDDALTTDETCPPLSSVGNGDGVLDPAESIVCTASHPVAQADLDAGSVSNSATASAGGITSNPDTAVASALQSPALDTVKALASNADEDGSGDVSAGDTLTYTVTVTNTGNVTLTGVQVTDPLITPSSESCASLAPGSTCVLSGSYAVTQTDVDAGRIVNTGTGDSNEAGPVSDQLDTPVGQNPAIAIVKTATFNDENGDGFGQVGETLDYAFEVVNTGNVTLTNIVVTDPLLGVDGGPLASLAVGAIDATTFAGTYTLTQADLDNGQVENQATATGQDPDGQPVSDVSDDDSPAEDDPTVTPLGRDSALSLAKQASLIDDNDNGAADVGETIDYTLTAVNSGSVTLADVVIDDPRLPALDCTPSQPAELAPGASLVCTGGYTVAQADVDAGGDIVNTATATAPDPDDPNAPPLEDSDTTGTGVCAADTGSIAGTVWEDLNRDNVIDGGEPRYPSFVTLGAPGAAPEELLVTTAGTNGEYAFADVPEGSYELRILEAYLGNNFDLYAIQPPLRTISVTRCGVVTEDFNFASPLDGVIGDFVWFDANEDQAVDEFRDADGNGVLTQNPIGASFAATDFEWVDLNQNGDPDDGEFRRCGLAGVRVDLFDGNGVLVGSRSTNLRGEYFFRGLALGQAYTAEVDTGDPANLAAAQQFALDGNCIVLAARGASPARATAARGSAIAGCGNTTPLSVTSASLSAASPVDDDLDYGLVCGVAGRIDLDKALTGNADEDGSGDVSAGDTLTYTITATNTGSVTLSGVIVSDSRITPDSTTCSTLAQGASCVLVGSYVVTAADERAGSVLNTASVDSDQSEPVSTQLETPVAAPPQPPADDPVPVPATGLFALLALLAGLLAGAGSAFRSRRAA